jgi:mannose-6-phosphate isomerase-like protein (cupin superfamily)
VRYIYDTDEFPYAEFGDKIKRQIRLVFSPDIGNEKSIGIVVGKIPPGGVAECHLHEESDELIHFNIAGKAIIEGKMFDVPENGFVFAPKGSKHECINISKSDELQLLCIFIPAFKAYGKYPELIEQTKKYLENK